MLDPSFRQQSLASSALAGIFPPCSGDIWRHPPRHDHASFFCWSMMLRIFSPMQCWDLGPPFWPLEASLFGPFLASVWPLKSRPPMKSGTCLHFDAPLASMLFPLLFFCAVHDFPTAMLGLKPSFLAFAGSQIRLVGARRAPTTF